MVCAASALLFSGCSTAGAVTPPAVEEQEPPPPSASAADTEASSEPTLTWKDMSSDDLCAAASGSPAVSTLIGTTATKLVPKNATGAACGGLGENNSGFNAVVTQASNAVMTAEQMQGALQSCDSKELFDTELQGYPVIVVYCTSTDAVGTFHVSGYSQIWADDFNAYITLNASGTPAPDSAGYFALIPQMWTEILG